MFRLPPAEYEKNVFMVTLWFNVTVRERRYCHCQCRPFSHYCSFCEVSYDVIGTMEDFEVDVEFIARKMNISELLDHKAKRTNQTPDSQTFSDNQTERIAAHFSLLERDVRLKLFHLYKMDFEMFGYDAAQYL